MILLIDNYDSFVHNLARHFRMLGKDTVVVRNDELTVEEIRSMQLEAIVLSPGPCTPHEAGICLQVVDQLHSTFPILGICLGHQAIVQSFGGNVVSAPWPFHGRASQVFHDESELFLDVSNPFQVGRYHSLIAEASTIPSCFKSIATTQDEIIMAVQHRVLPIVGLQFHPESILTEGGLGLLENFLTLVSNSQNSEAVL